MNENELTCKNSNLSKNPDVILLPDADLARDNHILNKKSKSGGNKMENYNSFEKSNFSRNLYELCITNNKLTQNSGHTANKQQQLNLFLNNNLNNICKNIRISKKAREYYHKGDFEKALYYLNFFIKLNKESIQIVKNICLKISKKIPDQNKKKYYIAKGISYIKKQKFEKAVYYIAQSLYFMPENFAIRYLLALNLLKI